MPAQTASGLGVAIGNRNALAGRCHADGRLTIPFALDYTGPRGGAPCDRGAVAERDEGTASGDWLRGRFDRGVPAARQTAPGPAFGHRWRGITEGQGTMNASGGDGSSGAHGPGEGGRASRLKTSVHATLHCLLGCSIGEFAGLAIGVTLGLGTVLTITLAVVLAFITGLALAIQPLVRQQGMSAWRALQTIWLGEVVSIAAMEIAMNAADYAVGGVQVQSMADPLFWLGFGVALPVGFIAAFPINYWLIGRNLKHCH